ncbi:uncharacterized protein LOC116348040 [Contarinia nasturtii]|uniref:uncharacterized protein LOC116348040 n=1 Tax=Contarinia nasturtii TaxID=265458 RepID=UPI0012D3B505|nr:uncharacterized protein LOC116348040 [Contarinia nasturtii]
MESDALNYKSSRKIIGYMGIAFSFALITFFGYLFILLNLNAILMLLIFFSNLIASFFWFNGNEMKKTEIILSILVLWGFELNLWTSVIFRWLWTCVGKRENDVNLTESFIFTSTLCFVIIYMFFVMSYVSLKEMIKKKTVTSSFGWKTTAIASAWLITALISAQTMDYLNFNSVWNFDRFGSLLVFCFSLTASITLLWLFLCGIINNKVEYMLTSVIFWTISLVIWVIYLFYNLDHLKSIHGSETHSLYTSYYIGTAFYLVVYIAIVMSYISMKKSIQNRQFNVTYMVAPSDNNGFTA